MAVGLSLAPIWIRGPREFGLQLFGALAIIALPTATMVLAWRRSRLAPLGVLIVIAASIRLGDLPHGLVLAALLTVVPWAWAMVTGCVERQGVRRQSFAPAAVAASIASAGFFVEGDGLVVEGALVVAAVAMVGVIASDRAATAVAGATTALGRSADSAPMLGRTLRALRRGAGTTWAAGMAAWTRLRTVIIRGARWIADESERPSSPESERRGVRAMLMPIGAWFCVWYAESVTLSVASRTSAPRLVPDILGSAYRVGWGTGDYWNVAEHGYVRSQGLEAVFPAMAIAMRAVAGLTGDLMSAGVLVSTVSGLAATLLFWLWMSEIGVTGKEQRIAVWLFLLYPYSFLLAGIAYSDELLLALVVATLLFVEKRWTLAAGVVAGIATFTRPNALPLIPALIVMTLCRDGVIAIRHERDPAAATSGRRRVAFDRSRLRLGQTASLLSVSGVAAYAAWLARHRGDPFYFVRAQNAYGHQEVTELSAWLKMKFINGIPHFTGSMAEAANHVVTLPFIVGFVALVPTVRRRFGEGYCVFLVGLLLLTWVGTIGFAPAGRYLLPALPMGAAIAARWLCHRRRARWLTYAVLGGLSIALAATFGYGGIWAEW